MGFCRDCIHWKLTDDDRERGATWGLCDHPSALMEPTYSYSGIITAPDFGCVQFEQRSES